MKARLHFTRSGIAICSLIALVTLLSSVCLIAQSAAQNDPATALKGVNIHWRVITNGLDASNKSISEVELSNDGDGTVPATGWALYYNFELPGEPQPADAPFSISRVNGDFFRAAPTANFTPLAPGQSVKFKLISEDPILAYSVSPGGFFFVLDAVGKNPPVIIPVPEASIKRFIDSSQMYRGKGDELPYSSPEERYLENHALSLLPAEQLGRVLPTPTSVKDLTGSFTITPQTVIFAPREFANEATYFNRIISLLMGSKLTVLLPGSSSKTAIRFQLIESTVGDNRPTDNSEGYKLVISPTEGITLSSRSAAGIFYGIQTMRALIPLEALNTHSAGITLPAIEINDAPRFHHRGLMLDVARNFQSKAEVLKLLDIMALYKLNVLHLHLIDDEGWRLEIAGLPELTSVGGRRGFTPADQPAEMLPPALDSGPSPDSPSSHGSGFYTRADYIEILRHAKELHIEVIPEIEGPGHMRAAIQSMLNRYRHYSAAKNTAAATEYLLTDPDEKTKYQSVQGYADNVMNVCIPSTLHFMDKVINEIASLYSDAGVTLQRVHIGGDEVPHSAWEHTAACQKLSAAQRDPQALEHSYMDAVSKLLSHHGARPTAWEEAVLTHDDKGQDTVEENLLKYHAVPLAWRNIWGSSDEDNSYRMANAGYDVVMAEASNLYFDMLQSKEPEEPGTYWAGFLDTRQVFQFTPSNLYHAARADSMGHPMNPCKDFANKPQLSEEGRKHILGLQGQVWSERVLGPDMMEYFFFPRAIALAERAWTPEPKWEASCSGIFTHDFDRDFNQFANQLGQREFSRLDAIYGGVEVRIPPPGAVIENGILSANTNFPGLAIRYTQDGSEPTPASNLYTAPVKVRGTVNLKCFDAKGHSSRTSTVIAK
jgi:hexosaminidase